MSLTQTEIMLVLAVVVLLLLLVKDGELTAVKTDLVAARERISNLAQQSEVSEEAMAVQRDQVDLAREVKDVLVRGGAAPPGETNAARLHEKDVSELRRVIEERRRQVEETALMDSVLERAGLGPADVAQSRRQQIDQLGSAAEVGAALRNSLSPERQRALQDALERDKANVATTSEHDEPPAHEGDAVRELLAEWLQDVPASEAQLDNGLGDQVGFDPCWPRPGGAGERRYYISYDVTYTGNQYRLKPHSDWQAGVPIVDEALAGPLSVLRSYPRMSASTQEMLAFGRRINAALDPLRESGQYAPQCLLVVTLNEEASGAVAKFLRRDTGLYPITR